MIYGMYREYLQNQSELWEEAKRASANTRVAQQYHLSPTEPPSDDGIDDNDDDNTKEWKNMKAMLLEEAEAEAAEKKKQQRELVSMQNVDKELGNWCRTVRTMQIHTPWMDPEEEEQRLRKRDLENKRKQALENKKRKFQHAEEARPPIDILELLCGD